MRFTTLTNVSTRKVQVPLSAAQATSAVGRLNFTTWSTQELLGYRSDTLSYGYDALIELLERQTPLADVLEYAKEVFPRGAAPYTTIAESLSSRQVMWALDDSDDMDLLVAVARVENLPLADRAAACLKLANTLNAPLSMVCEAIDGLKVNRHIFRVLRSIERFDVLDVFALKAAERLRFDEATSEYLYARVIAPTLATAGPRRESFIGQFIQVSSLTDATLQRIVDEPCPLDDVVDSALRVLTARRELLTMSSLQLCRKVGAAANGDSTTVEYTVATFIADLARRAGDRWPAVAQMMLELDQDETSVEQLAEAALDACA